MLNGPPLPGSSWFIPKASSQQEQAEQTAPQITDHYKYATSAPAPLCTSFRLRQPGMDNGLSTWVNITQIRIRPLFFESNAVVFCQIRRR